MVYGYVIDLRPDGNRKDAKMEIKSRKKILSIVIKNENTRICVISKKGKAIKVYSSIVIPTPEGSVSDGELLDKKALAEAINQTLVTNGITTKDVVFSIVSGKIATKEVLLPDVKEKNIADIVEANSSEYFPVEVNDYIIKHTILERFVDGDIKKLRLQLVAAPKIIVNSYMELAEILGLSVVTIDYFGNSIVQLINKQIGNEFCTVINIEGDQAVVSILDGNILKMQRTVPYGNNLLFDYVKEKLNVSSDEEARMALYQEAFLKKEENLQEITDNLLYLFNGIRRITDYYVSRSGGKNFDKVYVLGEVAQIPGFVEIMAGYVSAELVPITQFENISVEENAMPAMEHITAYIPAIGAIINPVDLVPKKEEAEKKEEFNLRNMLILLGAAVIVSAVLVLVPLMDKLSYDDKIEKSKKTIEELDYINDMVKDYYVAKDKVSDANAFKSITVNNDDYLHLFISQLEKNMPSDMKFSGMSVSSGSVNVSGTAGSKSSVAKLIQQLGKIPSVANVYVGTLSENMDNTGAIAVNFTLTCTFGEVKEEE